MADVRVLKFDVGSSTDQALQQLKADLSASSASEAMRRSLGIAQTVMDFKKEGKRIFVRDPQGNIQELVIPA